MTRGHGSEFRALLQKIAGGDQSALTALYDGTKRLLFGLVLRIVSDRASAEEVLLDVYTQVWRHANSYDPKRGGPMGWLMTIARTRAIDRLRAGKQQVQRQEPLEVAERETSKLDNPEEATVTAERQRLVRSALESLAPEQRQVIELAYYSGLSHSEIAATLGRPLGTIKTRTRLAMIKLSDLLRPVFESRDEILPAPNES